MRDAFAEALYQAAKADPSICVVVADISPAGSMAKFAAEFPDRFINVGVAEQSMIGICAGLAMKGKRPFAYTIATFALYRPFEFIRSDICYQNLPVTVVGMGAGLVYSTLGSTHHSQEDIAIASALPNMQVIAPCDPSECADAVTWCAVENNGPVYLRIGKAGEPDLTDDAQPWWFGKARWLALGDDVCILTYGTITKDAVTLRDRLAAKGKTASVVCMHTLKPLDRRAIYHVLSTYRTVIVMEEHVLQGGLGAQVKQIAWDIRAKCRLDVFTLRDEFIHNYGSHADLLDAHDLSVDSISASVAA